MGMVRPSLSFLMLFGRWRAWFTSRLRSRTQTEALCGTGVPKWRNSMSLCDIWELSQNSCCDPEAELEGIPCEHTGPCFMSALARLLCPKLCQKNWRIINDLINLEVPPLLEGTCRLWLNLPLSFDLLVGRVIFSRSSHPPKKKKVKKSWGFRRNLLGIWHTARLGKV